MITLKCKMCGGALAVPENSSTAECEYCGATQTIPRVDDERIISMFERANAYRANNEFDKATIIYENIVAEKPNEAEAYWGLCLCRYGIEYVTDPRSGKKIPTCHRTQFKSILQDSDFIQAVNNTDALAADVYRKEAQYIDSVQKNILAISSKEEPFDIFICYKESDEYGGRTVDSVIAQDIYDALTQKGYKVFFARITLEDKLGSAYEPYIFAALNSAKIMLVVGTRPENFNAVWVKNEWSRYLSLIEQGQKKSLIPCYRDMTPYDMPAEFRSLQSQDVSKIGYMQDLLRGVSKLIDPPIEEKSKAVVRHTVKPVTPPVTRPPVSQPPVNNGFKPIITKIVSVGTNDLNNPFPPGAMTPVINPLAFRGVSFQAELARPIGITGTVNLLFRVYDRFGNIICNEVTPISVTPANNKFGKVWILRGNDGSIVQNGAYRVEMAVGDSDVRTYNFTVVQGGVANPNVANMYTKPKKSLGVYLVLCFFLGAFGVHDFYAGRTGRGLIKLVLTLCTGLGGLWALVDFIIGIVTRKVPTK